MFYYKNETATLATFSANLNKIISVIIILENNSLSKIFFFNQDYLS